MHAVSLAVLMITVVMARADQMSDLLNLPPLKERIYIFDITSEATVDDLKAALGIRSNDTSALISLAFPEDSEVTQHAVEHIDEYLNMIGLGRNMQENYTTEKKSPNAVLFFIEFRRKLPETTCSKTNEMEMRYKTKSFIEAHHKIKPEIYRVIATYPSWWFQFYELEDNVLQNVMKKLVAPPGRYGHALLTAKRVIRI